VRACRRNAEVAFEVRMVVPAERGDTLALAQPEPLKRRAERARTAIEVRIPMPAQALAGKRETEPPPDIIVSQ
jgi:hypothetical protein